MIPIPWSGFNLPFHLGEANDQPRAIAALASIAIRDINSLWTRTAVLSSIAGRTSGPDRRPGQRDGFLTNPAGQAWLDELAFLVGSERRPAEVDGMLRRLQDAGARSDTLDARGAGTRPRAAAVGRIVPENARGSGAEASARMHRCWPRPIQAAGSDGPLDRRLVAIRLVGLADTKTARRCSPPCSMPGSRQPFN